MIFRKGRKTVELTDDSVKQLEYEGGGMTYWRDAGCRWLCVGVSEYRKRSYYFVDEGRQRKVLGSVYEITLDRAREIATNIHDNYDEFQQTEIANRVPICRDIEKNGMFPRRKVESLLHPLKVELILHHLDEAIDLIEQLRDEIND